MNDNATKWIEALRSGEFAQAMGMLRDARGGYCCLGVACELYRREIGGEWEGDDNNFLTPDGAVEKELLPKAVRDWIGLDDYSGVFESDGGVDSLVARNDSGETFTKIADLIESTPTGLFL